MTHDRLVLADDEACDTMNKKDDDQSRDKLLLRLLKMPPQSRAELAEAVRRAKEEKRLINIRAKRASVGKRAPSV
jgi:hypothetical protein